MCVEWVGVSRVSECAEGCIYSGYVTREYVYKGYVD